MRILVFSQYFTPEVTAAQVRVHTFAKGLAERGHEVEVVCEVPSHPEGVVHPGYGGRVVERRELDGFAVRYVWVATSPTKNMRTRLALYASYTAGSALVGAALRRPDVVFASSPPLPVGVGAAAAAARHRVPWVFDVRDLWPEAAVAMGELSNPRVVALAERLERALYRNATAITTVTEPFRAAIASRAQDAGKVTLLPNGTTPLYLDAAELEPDRGALALPRDRFVWAYAGNLSAAQGLESAIDAAGLLGEGFELAIVGHGPLRGALEARARRRAPGGVSFHGQMPPERAVLYLRAADSLLVPLAPDPVLSAFVPSKLFDCCAVGRPVIVAAAGEPQRLAGQTAAALPVAPGDPEALAAAVRRLRDEPDLRTRLAAAGRPFAADHLRERQVDRLEGLLGELAAASPAE